MKFAQNDIFKKIMSTIYFTSFQPKFQEQCCNQ